MKTRAKLLAEAAAMSYKRWRLAENAYEDAVVIEKALWLVAHNAEHGYKQSHAMAAKAAKEEEIEYEQIATDLELLS